jgi:hypothetical protein
MRLDLTQKKFKLISCAYRSQGEGHKQQNG